MPVTAELVIARALKSALSVAVTDPQAVGVGSDAIASMCRSIAGWAEAHGKPKQMPEVEDLQPLVQRIQVSIHAPPSCDLARTRQGFYCRQTVALLLVSGLNCTSCTTLSDFFLCC